MLFESAASVVESSLDEPDFFADLNLDQVVGTIATQRTEYELSGFYHTPLHDPEAVRYRHEVSRDLERSEVLDSVSKFADGMRRMRQRLTEMDELRNELQQHSWFVAAVEIYCDTVRTFAQDLEGCELQSRGLTRVRRYLTAYIASGEFRSLVADAQAVEQGLADIRYRVAIRGLRVTVSRYEGDADYSLEVDETFARFRQGAVKNYLVSYRGHAEMNHVEAQILELVARLNPEPFERRAQFCSRYRGFVDDTVARFDREVQFYVGYLELIAPLRTAGLCFCYPRVSAQSKATAARETFDIALANKLVPDERRVVCNDFHLDGPERWFVVSGPNNGGKTTFARLFGQLHYLAALGLPVPGEDARLFLADRIFSHFEREEDIQTLRGKFEDELVRVHEILEHATGSSVIVMNESFNSTTLRDALVVGSDVMRRFLGLGCLGVYVTFVDEIAALSDATVSMVTEVVPDNPAERTFRVLRRPADGLAYAWAIAEKYGLTYERLLERVT